MFALLLIAGAAAVAQNAQGPVEKPAAPPKITYVGGLLRIDAIDATLADVLRKVAVLTGVTIDLPAGASSERMPVVELGPGLPRQILASLLSDSGFDYLIQASNTDPEKIQNVLLMARDKKGGATNGADVVARASRSPYARSGRPEEAPAPESPAPAPPENAIAQANSLTPQPPSAQPEQPAAPPEPSMPLQLSQQNQSSFPKPGQLSPPQDLSQQNISQQLQQMYQQRVQMGQTAGNPGSPQAPGTVVR